jgi:hypothetical protein
MRAALLRFRRDARHRAFPESSRTLRAWTCQLRFVAPMRRGSPNTHSQTEPRTPGARRYTVHDAVEEAVEEIDTPPPRSHA